MVLQIYCHFWKTSQVLLTKENPVDVIYLDFAKAFDKVPHLRLIHKIKCHGITDNIAAWIAEWLKDRKQRVGLNGARSDLEDVLSGVPQDSVLGPMLFLLFVNDIDTVIASHIQQFADDCKVYQTVHTNAKIAILQEDIKIYVNGRRTGRWSLMLKNARPFISWINKCDCLSQKGLI